MRGTVNLQAIGVAALCALRVTLDLARLQGRPARYWNWEEAYNFTVAWYAWWAGLWDQAAHLQAKAFCGGCSVVSALALPALAIGGDELLAWKAVPLVWTVATMIVGFKALESLVGRPAGWAWLVVMAVPPGAVRDLGLMAWGNHNESTLFVLLALWAYAKKRPLLLGLALGVGFWFCRTSAYGWVLLPLSLAWGRGAGWAGIGLCAALLSYLPAARGDVGDYQLTLSSLAPGPDLVPRLLTLFGPESLGSRAWPDGHTNGLWVLVPAGVALLARPAPAVVALVVAFAALFGASDFVLPRVGNAAPLLNFRYHAPWLHLLLLVCACGLGAAGWRRWLAAVAVAGLLVGSSVAEVRTLVEHPPKWQGSTPVIDHAHFAGVAVGRLRPERLASATSSDPRTEATLRRMQGYQAALRVRQGSATEQELAKLQGAALEGFGQGLLDGPASLSQWNQRLGAIPEIGRGMGWNLGLELLKRGGPLPVDPRAGLDEGAPCGACVAEGFALIGGCRGSTACLDALLTADEAVVHGAGVACRAPGRPRAACEELAERYGPIFRAGLDDAMAGSDEPFRIRRP